MSAAKEGQESVLKHFLESGSTYIIQMFFIALAAQTYSRTPLPYSMLQLGFVIVAAFTWEWWMTYSESRLGSCRCKPFTGYSHPAIGKSALNCSMSSSRK
jgi:hypothetical protein